MSFTSEWSEGLPLEDQVVRQEKIIQALVRRSERQNDVGPAAFRAFESAIALQERVEEQTRDLERVATELESIRYERERTRRSLVEALSSMADGFVLFVDGKLNVANDFFLNLLPDQSSKFETGLSTDAFFRLIATSADFRSSDRPFAAAAAQLNLEETSFAVVMELRGDRWFKLNAQHTSHDNILLLVTEITDLVQRNRVEKESLIDFQKDYLQAVFQNLSSGVCTLGSSGKIILFNLPFRRLLGLADEDLAPGMQVDDLFRRLRDLGRLSTDDLAVLRQWAADLPDPGRTQYRVRHASGRILDIRANRLPDGSYVIEVNDVTLEVRQAETLEERVRERTEELIAANRSLSEEYSKKAKVEEQLRLAKERVEAAMSSKTRFLATASHDLLQPINAAQLMISTLRETTRDTDFSPLVERLHGSFTSAEQLLRSLLDISRLESAHEDEISVGPVNLAAILDGVHSDQAILAEQKNIQLDFVPCSATVQSDALYLVRSVQNLVVNALQYTPAGGRVLVGCRRQKNKLSLQVWDTGIGISASDQKRVFDEFTRAEGAKIASGMGLGLSVVDRACRLLGHKLTLRSKPGVGSVFSIELDLLEGLAPPPAPTGFRHFSEEEHALDLIALVIENDRDVLFATTTWLEQSGASVLAVATIQEALDCVSDMGMPPDIILADFQLDHGESGVEAIDRIRASTGVHVPAILITANRSEGLREAARLNEVSVLTKPVKLSRLRRMIEWKTENSYKSPV